jgi:hypothetical protein
MRTTFEMKKLLSALLLVLALPMGGYAQILSSADPEADSVAFAKVRARMDCIRQYRPTVGLVLAGGADIGQLFRFTAVHFQVIGFGVLADNHSRIDRNIRINKHRTAVL